MILKHRISFGDLSCRKYNKNKGLGYDICSEIMARLKQLENLGYSQLEKFKPESSEVIYIKKKKLIITTYKEQLLNKELLIATQGFLPTLIFPNYISFNGIGKMFADGLIINSNEEKTIAPIESLLKYW